MNYTLGCPLLKHIALVKTATTLWNQDDIRALMSKLNFAYETRYDRQALERRKEWREIENKVTEKVPQLSLPQSLKEEILGFIKPVGLKIFKWINYDNENCYLGIDLPNELFWTPNGTIDLKKTAEVVIKDEKLDLIIRYKFACIYCLEDAVQELWNKIPENCRKSFYSDEDPIKGRQQDLVVLWTYDIKGELNKLVDMIKGRRPFASWQPQIIRYSPYQYAFELAAACGNKQATHFFLKKLTPRERNESLVETTKNITNRLECSDVLFFLLSQMEEEQQTEVFEDQSNDVLECLLEWPWQSFFMETANRVWGFLNEVEGEVCLLTEIINKVLVGYKDYDYQNLFGEFWKQSTNSHKRYVLSTFPESFLLDNLFEIGDKDNLKLILNDATRAEKEEIVIFSGKWICHDLVDKEKWNLLKTFIQEYLSLLAPFDMIKFKGEFKEEFNETNRNKFFQLLDELIPNKKRSMEDDESSSAKKLHE